MSLFYLLNDFKKSQYQALFLELGKTPQWQRAGRRLEARSSIVAPNEWNLIMEKVLSPVAKKELHDLHVTSGLFQGENGELLFQVHDLGELKRAVFFPIQFESFFLLPGTFDPKILSRGLHLVACPNAVGRVHGMRQIVDKMPADRAGVVFSQEMPHGGWLKLPDKRQLFQSLSEGADWVVVNGDPTTALFQEVLQLSECSKTVLWFLPVENVMSTLWLWVDLVKKYSADFGISRTARILRQIASFRLATGNQDEPFVLTEILPMNSHVLPNYLKQDWRALEQILIQSPEKSGVQGVDQSLLQQVIRRKLDIKRAFELADDPDRLDRLFKKVGI